MSQWPLWTQAFTWGLVASSSLLIGSIGGYFIPVQHYYASIIMAFGSGVLLSAVPVELLPLAYGRGDPWSTILGFFLGGALFTVANVWLSTHGASHRQKGGRLQKKFEIEAKESGVAIFVGAVLDGIPESLVLGLSFVSGKINLVMLVAIFISNIPEAAASSVWMKESGRSPSYILGHWSGLVFLSGVCSALGYGVSSYLSVSVVSFIVALAAGGILTMVVDTMVPEAYMGAKFMAGIATLVGFIVSFVLGHYS